MKKIYLLSAIALSTSFLSAQLLESDNFNTLTNGDVGTSTTFGAPGQGGLYTNGGANSDYQIVDIDPAHGKSIQISSGNTAVATSNRQVVKPGLATAWTARTAGNDILQGKYEIYTGTAVGATRVGGFVQSSTAGIVGIHYNSATKTLNGNANLTPSAGGASGFFTISGLTPNTYPANTWISVEFTYDPVNGVITYTIDGVKSTLSINNYTITKNLVPSQHNLINQVIATPANTMVNTGALDNYSLTAVNAATLGVVTVGEIEKTANVSIYPNPTADYINVKSTSKVISVNVVDLSGKSVVSKKSADSQIDVRNLTKGTYIITVETDNGTETKKFIKK